MNRTRIKICGITHVDDAQAAARLGADAVGLIFYRSAPRYITPDAAREILKSLPPFVTPVALFVDAEIAEIRSIVEPLGIRHVQLHGHESPAYVAELSDRVILKAVRADASSLINELNSWRTAIAEMNLAHLRGFVLETAGKGVGGTGRENDWATIASAKESGLFNGLPPMIAAGGLRPENVGRVIRELRPWAVDVSSGVEETLRRKSPEKLAAFCLEVHKADQ